MIIALNGRARSGKDTGGRFIQELLYPRVVYTDAFADRLKRSLSALVNVDRDILERLKETDNGCLMVMDGTGMPLSTMSIRKLMERYGTESHRDVFGTNFWIKLPLEDHAERTKENETAVTVFTDLRFPNEAEAVRATGGVVWEIVRPQVKVTSDHSSNQPLPRELVDRVIMNDGGIAEYRYNLAIGLRDLLGVAVSGPVTDQVVQGALDRVRRIATGQAEDLVIAEKTFDNSWSPDERYDPLG